MIGPTSTNISLTEYISIIRRYWADNNQYVRDLIRSILFNYPDQEAIEQRLRGVASDYTNLFLQIYGGETLPMTVTKYFDAVIALAKAYRDNNLPLIEDQRSLLHEALEELADFYIQNNIYLDSTSIRMLLHEYGNLLETQIASLAAGDFEGSFNAYDSITELGYRLADDLAYGIVKQLRT